MVRGTLFAFGLFVLSVPLGAQQFAGPYWAGDCSTAVRLKNNIGLPLGAVWIAIKDDDVNNPVEIGSIFLTDLNGTKVWDVDDNEDGDNDDGESDTLDSTARGNPEGWHRVQARTNADVIPPDAGYRITLCGEDSSSLQFRPIEFFFSQPGVVGGDGGAHIVPGLFTILAADGNFVQATLDEAELPPLTDLTFTLLLKNGNNNPLPKINVFARQTDVTILDVTSSAGGTYDLPSRTYTFSSPLPAGGSTQMTFTLNQLSAQGRLMASAVGVTEVVFERFVPPAPGVPSLGTWGKLALVALLGGVGFAVLRRR